MPVSIDLAKTDEAKGAVQGSSCKPIRPTVSAPLCPAAHAAKVSRRDAAQSLRWTTEQNTRLSTKLKGRLDIIPPERRNFERDVFIMKLEPALAGS